MVNFFVNMKLRIINGSSHFFIYGSLGLINPLLTSCGLLFGSAHSIESSDTLQQQFDGEYSCDLNWFETTA